MRARAGRCGGASGDTRAARVLRRACLAVSLVLAPLPWPATAAGEVPADRPEHGRVPERTIAAECFARARLTQQIRLNPGVYNAQAQVATPLSVELPIAADPGIYADCMQRHGLAREVAEAAYFDARDRCRAQARRVHIGDGLQAGRIGGQDRAAYDACMRDALGTLEVEVEIPAP